MAAQFQWNFRGFAEVRRLPAVLNALTAYANQKATQGGAGYLVKAAPQSSPGAGRGRAAVVTDAKGAHKEAKNHHLARR